MYHLICLRKGCTKSKDYSMAGEHIERATGGNDSDCRASDDERRGAQENMLLVNVEDTPVFSQLHIYLKSVTVIFSWCLCCT